VIWVKSEACLLSSIGAVAMDRLHAQRRAAEAAGKPETAPAEAASQIEAHISDIVSDQLQPAGRV
jgi:hypothetical protein